MFSRRALLTAVAGAGLAAAGVAQTDPLPSWSDGPAKQSILKFVAITTQTGSSVFIPPAERIAVFDNDGTLWAEQPMYFQLAFTLDRIKAMAPQHPEWTTTEPFKSVIAGDIKGALASGEKGMMEMLAATHFGMTTEEFSKSVSDWAATARHPKTKKLYTEMIYQPMVELLAYLRSKGYKTYIVSGGGQEFMRPWVEKAYGIPPEQVIGSHGELKYEIRGGNPVIVKEAKVALVDDKEGKPVGIQRFIGRRPVFAFGNSDGDWQMLQWTTIGAPAGSARFAGIVHHTDATREWAYDRQSHIGKLDKAWDDARVRGWTVVDMKTDWKRIFPFEK
jgi:phosphoserine phosphatase